VQDYHQLDIWQRAMAFTVRIYEFSAAMPDAERFGLTTQLRRAATSVPLNVAEGAGCSSNPEFARFLGYAYRSLKEVVTGLELCERLYPSLPAGPHPVAALIDEGNQIARMTHTLLQRLTPRTHNS
jgi:four helix bundle protein